MQPFGSLKASKRPPYLSEHAGNSSNPIKLDQPSSTFFDPFKPYFPPLGSPLTHMDQSMVLPNLHQPFEPFHTPLTCSDHSQSTFTPLQHTWTPSLMSYQSTSTTGTFPHHLIHLHPCWSISKPCWTILTPLDPLWLFLIQLDICRFSANPLSMV